MAKSVNTADEYDVIDHDETALGPEALASIRDWLQPTDYLGDSGEFRRHLSSQAPGTGLWICETDEYRKWHDSPDHGSLWIKGVPGAGKSVIAASVIQHLRTAEQCPVLFFFFRNIVAANFSPRALIQDWLAQLLPHSPKLQFALQSRLDTRLAETSDNDLIQLFLDGVSCVPKLYCVGDALDEMTRENRPFLDKLNGLATHRPRSLKLLMTSRPERYLQSALRDSSIVHISLQQRRVDADIVSYLGHRLDIAPKSAKQRQITKELIDMVAKRSEGLFLYAKLTMDQVEAVLLADDPVDIRAVEESLPVGLEQTYTSMLARQRQERGVSTLLQVLVLEAVTHASRPLRLNELASLMKCVCPDIEAPAGFKPLIATCCGPLIEVLEDETLQVIHHSFTEFLRGDTRNAPSDDSSSSFPIISPGKAHKRMAINCLKYLQSGTLLLDVKRSDGSAAAPSVTYEMPEHQVDYDEETRKYSHLGMKRERDPFDYREARLLHPFLKYAVENWSWHTSCYDVKDEELFTAVTDFLKPDGLSFRRWLVLEWGSTTKERGSTEGIPTGLHIAAFSGLSELSRVLIQQGSSVSAVDAQERTPLHWAAANGHEKVVSLLIERGGAPNPEDGRGLKPIHLAALRNHALVVAILLKAGVKPDTIKTRENNKGRLLGGQTITSGETAILYVCRSGHTGTVEAMIPFSTPSLLEQLLCESCRFNRTETVLAILGKSDVSGNATYRGATALYFACASANVQCVEALVRRGAEVRLKSSWEPRRTINGGSSKIEFETAPIHRLIQAWRDDNNSACQTILELLLKAGADLEQLDGKGHTALLLAAGATGYGRRGTIHIPAMRALLRAGADAKKTTNRGDTALHTVFDARRDPAAVRLLIEHGCDPNKKGVTGETALQRSVHKSGSLIGMEDTAAIATYLVEHGADPDTGDRYTHTAVYRAMSACPQIFSMLLSRCKGMAIRRNCWFGLPGHLNTETFTKLMESLLAEGIDINTKRKWDGRTLYLCFLTSEDKLRILRNYGANPDVVDSGGNNSLHIICRERSFMRGSLEMHISAGVDPLKRNNNGETLLHHAAVEYTDERKAADYVRWLISLGIPVNAINKQGETALHVFQRKNPRTNLPNNSAERVRFVDAIKDGNNVNFEIRDNDGLAVLHSAAMGSGVDLVTLTRAGGDLGFLTGDSQNALHLACRARKPNVVLQILEAPAAPDVNQKDRFGRTPLHYACASGNPESVAFLLKHGADVHAIDEDGSTPLHACAEFRTEQSIWDAHGPPNSWLGPPSANRLRPGSSRRRHPRLPWYQRPDNGWSKVNAKSFFSAISTIVKILLDANCDVSTVDKQNFTALDIALDSGGVEFIEVFAEDEALFARATRNLDNNKETAVAAWEVRQRMRAQMALMRPRSCLEILGADSSARDEVLKSPSRYLELLLPEDAAKLINEGFEADPLDNSNYNILRKLMEPHHLQVIELVPRLVSHYSSSAVLEQKMDAERKAGLLNRNCIWTPLQLACQSSTANLQSIRLLVEKMHVDVNARCVVVEGDRYWRTARIVPGGTALHFLAEADNYWQVEGIRYLATNGADVNVLDEVGECPLHVAARGVEHSNNQIKGFWKLTAVRILLDHGADPNILDKKGQSALHKASSAADIMQELLRRGADTAVGTRSPLFLAIYDQNLSALKALLDQGLSVDSLDEGSHSRSVHYSLTESRKVYALCCAAFAAKLNTSVRQSAPLLRCLVERGADLYTPLNDDETMIHFLFEFPEHEILDTLLQEPCVSRIDFNRRDQRGRTVLMAACDWRQVLPGYAHKHWDQKHPGPPVRILDHGADATLTDDEGKTALHRLLDNPGMPDDVLIDFINRKEVAPILLQKDGNGFSPLHYALRSLRPAVCEDLISKGADLQEPAPNGRTALHYIAGQLLVAHRDPRAKGNLRIFLAEDHLDRSLALWRKFLAGGRSINITDNAGNTPLHAFLLSPVQENRSFESPVGHLEHYDALFPPDSGVDVFAVNGEGETALHVVARREKTYYTKPGHDKALFVAMMRKGLDPLREDARGRSALDVASACGKDDIVEIFGRK